MARTLDRKLVAAAALALALLAINASLTWTNMRSVRGALEWVGHSRAVLLGLSATLAAVVGAETGQRGYLITGNFGYLDPYFAARRTLGSELDALERMTADNPAQNARVREIRQLAWARVNRLDNGIRVRRSRLRLLPDTFTGGLGRKEMDALRDPWRPTHARGGVAAARARAGWPTKLPHRRRRGDLLGAGGVRRVGGAASLSRATCSTARLHRRARRPGELLQINAREHRRRGLTHRPRSRVTDMNRSLDDHRLAAGRGRPTPAGVFRIVNEDTRAPVSNPAERALAEGVVVGLANHTVLIDRNGVDHPIDDSAAPIRRRDGSLGGCVLVFRDITEQKAAEAALRGAEARVRDALMQMGTPALLYAEDGEMLLVNQAFVEQTGYARAEVPTVAEWTRRAYGDRQPVVMATIQSLFGTDRRVDSGERDVKIADGRSRVWHFFTGPAGRDADGRRLLITTAVDVTEHNQVADSLREAARRKDEFVAMLAHELRNPLAPISNAVAIMKIAPADSDAFAGARAMVDRQLAHLVRLIDDLLDASRVTLGKLTLQRGRLDATLLLRDAVQAVQPVADRMQQVLAIEVPNGAIWIDGDGLRLSQVFGNLLGNAVKFTPPGGHVTLAARVEGGELAVTVSDDGMGIASGQIDSIFELSSSSTVRSSAPSGARHRPDAGPAAGRLHGGTSSPRAPVRARQPLHRRLPLARAVRRKGERAAGGADGSAASTGARRRRQPRTASRACRCCSSSRAMSLSGARRHRGGRAGRAEAARTRSCSTSPAGITVLGCRRIREARPDYDPWSSP